MKEILRLTTNLISFYFMRNSDLNNFLYMYKNHILNFKI